MPEIYGIEFDQAGYENTERCVNWLRTQPDLVSIIENRTFRLRHQRSLFMSMEPRRVWSWFGNIWRVSEFKIVRPDPHILIYIRTGGSFWEKNEIPTPSERYLKTVQAQDQKQREREYKKRLRNEENREKRRAQKGVKRERTPEQKERAKQKKLANLTAGSRERRERKISKKRKMEEINFVQPTSPSVKQEKVLSPLGDPFPQTCPLSSSELANLDMPIIVES